MEVAGAAHLHRALDLGLEIVELGHGRSSHVQDLVRHRDQRRVLPLAEHVAGLVSDRTVFAVRAAGGVALERCTPVFMYASLS